MSVFLVISTPALKVLLEQIVKDVSDRMCSWWKVGRSNVNYGSV